jgi:hypothetical protein
MNNPIPLEYLTSFSQTSQAMMQQLATGLLTSGDNATTFTRYSELASVQQNYLQQMGAFWVKRGWAESHAHDDTELCDACERSSD